MNLDFIFDPGFLMPAILLLPLAAAVFSAFFLRRSKHGAAIVSVTACGLVLAMSLLLLLSVAPAENGILAEASLPGFVVGSFKELSSFGLMLDANGATMLFVVTFVAFWIHVFSVGYMDDDPARGRFFAGLSIFMFSILGIILAKNLFMTFIFWELVGFSSYMLIAHYFETPYSAMASKKAFIANRVGDFGFLMGILLCYHLYGTTDFAALQAAGTRDTAVGLLLMCGFLGKSAQFPLHVWLTDAMAGPTPVSALIHAATMVAAGVFFMVRISFMLTGPVFTTMLWLCAGMAALAGIAALGQTDIKKSLAYSTLSHLGFMGAAIGLQLPEIALLHMAMHAFFKATLFLCAGSIIHACHHEQDMTKMGGLLKKMPLTAAAFVIAGFSIAAFPWFAGWYSKDMIISGALVQGNWGAFAALVVAAVGTALYIGRMFAMVFLGKAHGHGAEHAKESSAWMTLPLVVLGVVYSLAAGWAVYGWDWAAGKMSALFPKVATVSFAGAYEKLEHAVGASGFHWPMFALSVGIVVVGFALAIVFYRTATGEDKLREKAPVLYAAVEYRYCDALYDWYIQKVQQRIAIALNFINDTFVTLIGVRVIFAGIPAILGGAIRRFVYTGDNSQVVVRIALGSVILAALAISGALTCLL
ncbi:MAG: NADH-quinone oxidoreductase subunit L [Opitutales bacterium]|nr:NADH-quinone oxidoreductase subunit L [Opitutales bacterium]